MDQSTPVRKSRTSTADFLTWPETTSSTATPDSRSRRTNKPASGISSVMFGGQMSEEEAENVLKSAAKPCSGYKLREITGSGIFAADGKNGASKSRDAVNSNNKTGVRIYQQAIAGMSQISFGAESVAPKKHITLSEVAKLREMSGNLENEADAKLQKHQSEAKCVELCGNDIFGPPPEMPARPLTVRDMELKGHFDFGEPAPRSIHTSVTISNPSTSHTNIIYGDEPEKKTSKKILSQKFQVLTRDNIFESENSAAPEKPLLSSAKLKEMTGSDIFGDGKANSRKYYGGDHKPPGGESSITLGISKIDTVNHASTAFHVSAAHHDSAAHHSSAAHHLIAISNANASTKNIKFISKYWHIHSIWSIYPIISTEPQNGNLYELLQQLAQSSRSHQPPCSVVDSHHNNDGI